MKFSGASAADVPREPSSSTRSCQCAQWTEEPLQQPQPNQSVISQCSRIDPPPAIPIDRKRILGPLGRCTLMRVHCTYVLRPQQRPRSTCWRDAWWPVTTSPVAVVNITVPDRQRRIQNWLAIMMLRGGQLNLSQYFPCHLHRGASCRPSIGDATMIDTWAARLTLNLAAATFACTAGRGGGGGGRSRPRCMPV